MLWVAYEISLSVLNPFCITFWGIRLSYFNLPSGLVRLWTTFWILQYSEKKIEIMKWYPREDNNWTVIVKICINRKFSSSQETEIYLLNKGDRTIYFFQSWTKNEIEIRIFVEWTPLSRPGLLRKIKKRRIDLSQKLKSDLLFFF